MKTAPSRLLGRVEGGDPGGPLVLALGGIHGNEPAGAEAALEAARWLESLPRGELRGAFAALAGNRAALAAGTRFLDRDLNRLWRESGGAFAVADDEAGAEAAERADLRAALRAEVERHEERARAAGVAAGPIHFLDLHTSSAPGTPFACIGDTLRNRRFARAFPLPVILGLEEQVEGALLEFLGRRGLVTIGIEGGQHDSAEARANHLAAIRVGLCAAGALPAPGGDPRRHAREEIREAWRRLDAARAGLPRFLEIRYRHAIGPRDDFRMRPGYSSFKRVQRWEVLGHDREGEVRAHFRSLLLLPLYQKKGDDGFFLARELRGFWLGLSALLRRARGDRLVPLLPGVRRESGQPDRLLVNRRVARWYTIEIFHLFGFRKRRAAGDRWEFSRRPYDLAPPPRWEV